MYYGPDAEAARDAALSLRATQDFLADLDPADTEDALQRLLAGFAVHQTADGVWLDSRAWLITATFVGGKRSGDPST